MNDALLNKIRALLDQAQATNFPEEADAFFGKATALMETHNLTEAMVRSGEKGQPDEIVAKDFAFANPYCKGKMMIGWMVRKAFDVQGYLVSDSKSGKILRMFGKQSDIDAYEMLLAAVQLHATGEMLKTRPIGNARSFRASFLDGYASRIGVMLARAKTEARSEAQEDWTPEQVSGVALVLRDDAQRVRDAVTQAAGGRLRTKSAHTNVGRGYGVGNEAAGRFTGHQGRVTAGGQRALNA